MILNHIDGQPVSPHLLRGRPFNRCRVNRCSTKQPQTDPARGIDYDLVATFITSPAGSDVHTLSGTINVASVDACVPSIESACKIKFATQSQSLPPFSHR